MQLHYVSFHEYQKLNNGQKFDLEVRHNDRLYDGQTIALLEDNSY